MFVAVMVDCGYDSQLAYNVKVKHRTHYFSPWKLFEIKLSFVPNEKSDVLLIMCYDWMISRMTSPWVKSIFARNSLKDATSHRVQTSSDDAIFAVS